MNGQVVEMGFHSTQILNQDKYPIIVPNSFFSSQVIPRELLGSSLFMNDYIK